MFDLKKATKEELIDLLLVEAAAIENMLEVRRRAVYQIEGYPDLEFSMFVHEPARVIFVGAAFFKALTDRIQPEVKIEFAENRCGGKGEFNKRFFYLDLLGQKYEIFDLFKEV